MVLGGTGCGREVCEGVDACDEGGAGRDCVDEVVDGGFGAVGEREGQPGLGAEGGGEAEDYGCVVLR
jgi:hypothetical protein